MFARLSVAFSVAIGMCLTLVPATSFAADKPDATTQPSAGAATGGDLSGTWKWEMAGPGGDRAVVLKIKQDGDKVTGTISGFGGQDDDIRDGKVDNGTLTFKVVRDFNGNEITTNYTAKLSDGVLKGKSETVFARNFEGKRETP